MNALPKIGHLFYGAGLVTYGMQQIIIRDFRPQILPDFPRWVHENSAFSIVTGAIMVISGLLVAGSFKMEASTKGRVCLYFGFYFLALIIVSHIPYLLFVYPHKLSHLGSWGDALKALAFSGGSFVMADSFFGTFPLPARGNIFESLLKNLIPMGRVFYCTTIILFGCNHFVYDISSMVPRWFGMSAFWSYFGGAALMVAGTAILLKIYLRPVAFLLATMLFLWFLFLHIPGAIAHPYLERGNQIVSAFDALLFCGTALVLSQGRSESGTKLSTIA